MSIETIEQARQVYEGKPLTERWALARLVTPEAPAVVRQAAREELDSMIEDFADEPGGARIVTVARQHIRSLQDQTQGVPA